MARPLSGNSCGLCGRPTYMVGDAETCTTCKGTRAIVREVREVIADFDGRTVDGDLRDQITERVLERFGVRAHEGHTPEAMTQQRQCASADCSIVLSPGNPFTVCDICWDRERASER